MPMQRAFIERNRASSRRIRDLIGRLSDTDLQHPVGEHWTVSIALVHLAFWDRRVLAILDESERAGKLVVPSVDISVNDLSLPLWAAIPPREAARLAIEASEELDSRLAELPDSWLETLMTANERWVERALHRNSHLDEVDAALS